VLDSLVHLVNLMEHLELSKSNVASFFDRSTRYLNSLSTLALSLQIMGYHDANVDEMIRAANIPHSQPLSYVPSAGRLAQAVHWYLSPAGGTGISCQANVHEESNDSDGPRSWFRNQPCLVCNEAKT
jgi:hypothetical protein